MVFCLDTSVLVAVVYGEPAEERIRHILSSADRCVIGAPTLLESHIVLNETADRSVLGEYLEALRCEALPWTDRHTEAAVDAFDRFGKGRHPARLNFGDCMAYATAKVARLPLLFVGDDFDQTDLECVRA